MKESVKEKENKNRKHEKEDIIVFKRETPMKK